MDSCLLRLDQFRIRFGAVGRHESAQAGTEIPARNEIWEIAKGSAKFSTVRP
jgi:hypothetical protein